MSKWERIDDILTPKGIAELKAGQVLKFERADEPENYYVGMTYQPATITHTSLRIMRKTKDGAVWAKQIELRKPEDLEAGHAPSEVSDGTQRR